MTDPYMTIPMSEFETLHRRASFYLNALQRIHDECGHVCDDFETCIHRACQSSYEAWAIADAALKGETPESANAKAVAERRHETGDR
jgi:hypothetical protein